MRLDVVYAMLKKPSSSARADKLPKKERVCLPEAIQRPCSL